MTRLLCFIFAVFLVSSWIVFKVDAQDLDKVCQELLQNLDMNPQTVEMDTLQKCIKLWGERLSRTPNDKTIRHQHNRMQTFLQNVNGRVQRLPSPGRPRLGQVALEQPNVPEAAQQPQSSQVTHDEVTFELAKIRDELPKKSPRYRIKSTDCLDIVNTLLVTPNLPIPTGAELVNHSIILKNCIKAWERLRDKATNNKEKYDRLEFELGFLTRRAHQIQATIKVRQKEAKAIYSIEEKALIAHCQELVASLGIVDMNSPREGLIKYQADLKECIKKWNRIIKWQSNLKQELNITEQIAEMKNELTRVDDQIRKLENPKLITLDPTDCMRLAKELRLKPTEPIPSRYALTAMIKRLKKCITLLDNLWSQENNQAKRGTYMTAIDLMNGRLKLIEDTKRQRNSDSTKNSYRKRVETLKQSSQVDSMTGGQSGKPMSPVQVAPQSPRQIAPPSPNSPRRVAQPKPKSPPQVPQDPEVLKARCRELHLKGQLTRFPPASVGVTQVDHFTYFSALLESCLRMWEDRINKEGSESLIPQRGLFKRAHERAQGLLKRAISNTRNPKVALLKHTFKSPPRVSPKRKSPPKAPSPIRNSPPNASPKRKSPPKAPSPIHNSPPMESQSEFESEWNFNQFNGPQANQFQVPQVPPLPEECERLLNGDQLESPQPALANLLRRCWRLCEQRVRDADKISWSIFAESNKKSYEQVLAKQRDRFKEAFEKLNKLLKS